VTKPYDLENERAVIVACLVDPSSRRRAVGSVSPVDFQGSRYRSIYKAIVECERKGVEPDQDAIAVLSDGADYGGLEFLQMLFGLTSTKNIELHLARLRRDSARLQIRTQSLPELTELLSDRTVEHTECIKQAAEILNALRVTEGSALDPCKEWVEVLDARCAGGRHFVSTGYAPLDSELVEGFAAGNVSVIAGRTSNGKSTFVTDAVRRLLAGVVKPKILVVPLEIGRLRFIDKLVSSATLIETNKLRKFPEELTLEERDTIRQSVHKLLGTDDRLTVVDNPFFNLSKKSGRWGNEEALDKIEEILAEGGYDLTIWDLFQRSLSTITPNDVETALVRVQHMARRYGTHFVIVHQISRKVEERKDKRPRIDDLKGSGGYEEIPDLILLLHRERAYKKFMENDEIEINIGKQRDGPAGRTMIADFFPEVSRLHKEALTDARPESSSSDEETRAGFRGGNSPV
jgi:replicative DNA helicase